MSLSLAQTVTAVGPNVQASFHASGGTSPYVYTVTPAGAGGTINSSSGVYTAPASFSSNLAQAYDQIVVTDAASATANAQILVGSPLLLLANILQVELGLADDHIYLWDQKLFQPKDSTLYIAISESGCKPFSSVNNYSSSGGNLVSSLYLAMQARVDIDILSRGPDARDRKEEVLLALNSNYSEQQQEINSFYISPLSHAFINLSNIDGAAIPYRFKISVNMNYVFTKNQNVSYFNDFNTVNPDVNV